MNFNSQSKVKARTPPSRSQPAPGPQSFSPDQDYAKLLATVNELRASLSDRGRHSCKCRTGSGGSCGLELVPAPEGGAMYSLPAYFDSPNGGIEITSYVASHVAIDVPEVFWYQLAQNCSRFGTVQSQQIVNPSTTATIVAPDANYLYQVFAVKITHSVNQNGSQADFTVNIGGQREGGQAYAQTLNYTSPGPSCTGTALVLFVANENGQNVITSLQTSDAAYSNGTRWALQLTNITLTYSAPMPVGHTVTVRPILPRDPEYKRLRKLLLGEHRG